MRKLGLRHALSSKLREGKLIIAGNLQFTHEELYNYKEMFDSIPDDAEDKPKDLTELLVAASPDFEPHLREHRAVFDSFDSDNDGTLTRVQAPSCCHIRLGTSRYALRTAHL